MPSCNVSDVNPLKPSKALFPIVTTLPGIKRVVTKVLSRKALAATDVAVFGITTVPLHRVAPVESFVTTLSIIVNNPEVPQLTVVVTAKAGSGKAATNAPKRAPTSKSETK